ncbi:hypothetical protein V6N13_042702 [Hibiscus sabdariffa]|uniref:Uncharacterized protein n=1 Tax=Hibiscus sabdariffa TaxID=183260 RepID=A0ABR2G3R5_9ROSI
MYRSANCLSAIPPFCSIGLNGKFFNLEISKAKFEDERCWIDNEKSDWHLYCNSTSPCSSSRIQCVGKELSGDLKNLENEEMHLMSQKACAIAGVGNLGVDVEVFNNVGDLNLDPTQTNLAKIANGIGKNLRPIQLDELPTSRVLGLENGPNGNEVLFDVHVVAASTSNLSLGHSVTIKPMYDSLSRLYSIKPKLITHL